MNAQKRRIRMISISMLLFSIALLYARPSHGSMTPESINFGDVAIGSSTTASFTIANTDNQKIISFSFRFSSNTCRFSLPSSYVSIQPGESAKIDVIFSPAEIGSCSDTLLIYFGWSLWKEIPVTGTGVEATKQSQQEILLSFFDKSVKEGSLKGKGSGKSADNRLNALRDLLVRAGDMIERGKKAAACGQLTAASSKLDGFVEGNAIPGLRERVGRLMGTLGCK